MATPLLSRFRRRATRLALRLRFFRGEQVTEDLCALCLTLSLWTVDGTRFESRRLTRLIDTHRAYTQGLVEYVTFPMGSITRITEC
jgi:hypothetical protein